MFLETAVFTQQKRFTAPRRGKLRALIRTQTTLLIAATVATASAGGPAFIWNGGTGNWNVGANWMGGVVPPNGSVVQVDDGDAAASIVNLNVVAVVSGMTVDADDRVNILNGNRLQALGTIVNNGVIRVDSTGGNTYFQPTNGSLTLTGGGMVEFGDSPNTWMYKASAGGELINANNTIIGAGNLGWAGSPTNITNEAAGTVIAQGANQLLVDSGAGAVVTNAGVFRADGGTLRIQNNFDNTGGLVEALDGSVVSLGTCDLTGGELRTTGTGEITVTSSATDFLATLEPITNNAAIRITNGARLHAIGSLVNNSVIRIDSSGSGTYLQPSSGELTLTGGGTIELSDNANNWIYKSAADGELINVDNTIIGAGNLGWAGSPTAITNEAAGTVVAQGANPLLVDSGAGRIVTNAGVFRADGGTLRIQNNFDNTGGLVEALDGSFVSLGACDLSGGELRTTGAGEITVTSSATDFLATPEPITNNGTIRIASGAHLRAVGNLVNNSVIRIDSSAGGAYLQPSGGPLLLTGGGTVEFGDSPNTWMYKASAGGELINVDNTIIGAGNLGWAGSPTDITNDAGGTITAQGVSPLLLDSGAGALFTNRGLINAAVGGTLRVQNSLDNTDGELAIPNGATLVLSSAAISDGALQCGGTLSSIGSNSLNGVTLFPGDGIGTMTVVGNMPSGLGTTELDLGGFTAGSEHDVISATGSGRFDGTLRVRAQNGFVPAVGDRFTFAHHAGHVSGARYAAFESVGFPALLTVRVEYFSDHADLIVVRVGDINCDGEVTVSDIAPLVIALTQPEDYANQFPNCEIFDADINGDGAITVSDIAPFVALLTGG